MVDLKTPRFPFEINWPLESSITSRLLTIICFTAQIWTFPEILSKYSINCWYFDKKGVSLFFITFLSILLLVFPESLVEWKKNIYQSQHYNSITQDIIFMSTMRTNLLNWCNLVSISKKVLFYTFLVVNIYYYRGSPTYKKITNTVSTTMVFGLCTCKWGN